MSCKYKLPLAISLHVWYSSPRVLLYSRYCYAGLKCWVFWLLLFSFLQSVRSPNSGPNAIYNPFSNASLWFIERHICSGLKKKRKRKTGCERETAGSSRLFYAALWAFFNKHRNWEQMIFCLWLRLIWKRNCNISLLGVRVFASKAFMIWDKLVCWPPRSCWESLKIFPLTNLLISMRCGCHSVSRELCWLLHNVRIYAQSWRRRGASRNSYCSAFSLHNDDLHSAESNHNISVNGDGKGQIIIPGVCVFFPFK